MIHILILSIYFYFNTMSLIFNSEDNLPEDFFPVRRVNVKNILEAENLRECINNICIKIGEPLVLTGFNELDNWDSHLFSSHSLQANLGDQCKMNIK